MQQLQDIIEHAMQMGGIMMCLLLVAFLMLCWMFRPTISRIVEHFLGLPHTGKDNPARNNAGNITVNVTNVNIQNPTNVQIIPDSHTHHSYDLADLRSHWKILLGCLGAALLAWWLTGTEPKSHHEPVIESKSTQDEVKEPSAPSISANIDSPINKSPSEQTDTGTAPTPTVTAPAIRQTHLRGRGHSDSGREEPQYVGVVGYAAVYYSDLDWQEGPHDTPWHIKTYEKDKQFWNETAEGLEHKTKIVVLEQMLEHTGYDNYDGYLKVERLSDGRTFYIDVGNFITEPYWTYGDVLSAIRVGKCFAVYRQKSNFYPVNIDNKKVDLPDGTWVIVDGTTGTYGRGKPDNKTHQVTGLYWREDSGRYGGAFFNKDDLELQY